MFIQLFSSDPRHARISWSKLEEHRRSFSVLKLVRTVTLRTPTLVGLFSVLLWGYIVPRKGRLLEFYPLVFVVTKEVCGCAFRWAIDAFNTRGIRTATTTKLGGLTQACFELLLLLQLEAVAMMAPLTSLNLLLSLSLSLSLSRVTAVLLQLEAVAMMAPLTSLNLLLSLSLCPV
jgi:hypothetical protein